MSGVNPTCPSVRKSQLEVAHIMSALGSEPEPSQSLNIVCCHQSLVCPLIWAESVTVAVFIASASPASPKPDFSLTSYKTQDLKNKPALCRTIALP